MEGRNARCRFLAHVPRPGQGFPPPVAVPLLPGVLETHLWVLQPSFSTKVYILLMPPAPSLSLFLSALPGKVLPLKPAYHVNI